MGVVLSLNLKLDSCSLEKQTTFTILCPEKHSVEIDTKQHEYLKEAFAYDCRTEELKLLTSGLMEYILPVLMPEKM